MTISTPAAARFVNPTSIVKSIPLAFPVEVDGRVYSTICLHKISMRDLKTAIERAEEERKTNPDASPRIPIYFDEAGEPLPTELLDALEVDDFDAVDEAATAFLPRRFRNSVSTTEASPTAQTEPTPASGDTTGPSSSGSSAAPATS